MFLLLIQESVQDYLEYYTCFQVKQYANTKTKTSQVYYASASPQYFNLL